MENLGPDINTPGDEMFPYVRDSVTLYFGSNGHPGMGGLDLFKATQDSTGKWHVENLKAPINSMGDDFGITFEGDKEKGFFSSNRSALIRPAFSPCSCSYRLDILANRASSILPDTLSS